MGISTLSAANLKNVNLPGHFPTSSIFVSPLMRLSDSRMLNVAHKRRQIILRTRWGRLLTQRYCSSVFDWRPSRAILPTQPSGRSAVIFFQSSLKTFSLPQNFLHSTFNWKIGKFKTLQRRCKRSHPKDQTRGKVEV